MRGNRGGLFSRSISRRCQATGGWSTPPSTPWRSPALLPALVAPPATSTVVRCAPRPTDRGPARVLVCPRLIVIPVCLFYLFHIKFHRVIHLRRTLCIAKVPNIINSLSSYIFSLILIISILFCRRMSLVALETTRAISQNIWRKNTPTQTRMSLSVQNGTEILI